MQHSNLHSNQANGDIYMYLQVLYCVHVHVYDTKHVVMYIGITMYKIQYIIYTIMLILSIL